MFYLLIVWGIISGVSGSDSGIKILSQTRDPGCNPVIESSTVSLKVNMIYLKFRAIILVGSWLTPYIYYSASSMIRIKYLLK